MRVPAAEQTEPLAAPRATTIPQIDPVPRVSIQAFCETPETAAIVQAAIGDRRMSKTHVKQNMGGAAAAVEAYRNAPTPNVIVLEATANRDLLDRATRRTLALLRRGNESRRSRQSQRHRALPAVDGARGQRVSRRPVQRGRVRPGDFASLSRARRQTARARDLGHRRQGRRRIVDDRPQSFLGARHAAWKWRRSSRTSTWASARRASTTTRIRRRASRRRCSRPNASTRR